MILLYPFLWNLSSILLQEIQLLVWGRFGKIVHHFLFLFFLHAVFCHFFFVHFDCTMPGSTPVIIIFVDHNALNTAFLLCVGPRRDTLRHVLFLRLLHFFSQDTYALHSWLCLAYAWFVTAKYFQT